MRKLIVTTAALLASTALAAAQGMNPGQGNKSEGASPAPAQQRSAPAEKMDQSKPAQTTGQAQKDQGAQKADDKRPANAQMKQDDKAGATTGQKSTMDAKPDANKAAADKPDANKAASDSKANDTNRAATTNQRDTQTTGQGAAGSRAAVNLSTEQKTKVRTVIKEKVKAQPLTNVNFSISVGTRVPRDVRFYPLPVEIVEIHPAWRGYSFILVNDQIVIIEPSTFEIVAIIA